MAEEKPKTMTVREREERTVVALESIAHSLKQIAYIYQRRPNY
jgi:hypothetical protein